MKQLLALTLSVLVTSGCVSNTYRYYGLADPRKHRGEERGVTWNLKIESYRKSSGIVFVFWHASHGPPYHVNFTPYGEGLGKSVKITRLEVTMQDGTAYDVLNGQSVEIPVMDYDPRQARYKSDELPLKFKEGSAISIELHCQTGGTDFVIERNFVGKKKRTIESFPDALGAI